MDVFLPAYIAGRLPKLGFHPHAHSLAAEEKVLVDEPGSRHGTATSFAGVA
jgi:hypothetical protein